MKRFEVSPIGKSGSKVGPVFLQCCSSESVEQDWSHNGGRVEGGVDHRLTQIDTDFLFRHGLTRLFKKKTRRAAHRPIKHTKP